MQNNVMQNLFLCDEEDFNIALGRRLTRLRQSKRMSQENLGVLLGVRSQQIHKYETGENKMPPERIYKCAKMFGISVGYFYGEDEVAERRSGFNRDILSVAVEVAELPKEIRRLVYSLSREINKGQAEPAE